MDGKAFVDNYDSAAVANAGSLAGAMQTAIDWFSANLQCCLPVKIVTYDRPTRIATVLPLVKALTRKGTFLEKESFSVQTFQYAANGFVIDFPIVPGDVGWVIASDRYTRNVKETHEVCDLEDISMHRYASGFFIPDYYGIIMNTKRESDLEPYTDEDHRLVISSFDGKQKVSIGREQQPGEDIGGTQGDIRLDSFTDSGNKTKIVIKNGVVTMETTSKFSVTAGEQVDVTTPKVIVNATTSAVVTTPSATVHSPSILMDGGSGDTAVNITGTLTVTSDITSSGGEITDKRGVVLGTHTHKYAPGPGAPTDTAAPTA